MKSNQLRHPASHAKGVTLIEILLVIGLLVLLLSFAVPSMSGAGVKAEMSAAHENVQYSLQMARKVARSTESAVVMHISAAEPGISQTITFTSPSKKGVGKSPYIQDFLMPAEVVLVSDHNAFVFDERGLVENPGRISLVSTVDEDITETINVQ